MTTTRRGGRESWHVLVCLAASACGGGERSEDLFGSGASLTATDAESGTNHPLEGGSVPTSEDATSLADESEGDEGDEGGEGIFDVFDGETAGDGGGSACGCGDAEWSYVWIANSQEGTVSKINTRSLIEEGRYPTRPDGDGSPSRTSVSIDGRAMVVANRHTGLTMIWARPELCADTNGQPGIQTSTGKNDVLAFEDDECIAWHTAFPDKTVQRPVQWASGPMSGDAEACSFEQQKVWTTTAAMGSGPGQCGRSGVWVHRLDGTTGIIEDEFHIPDESFDCDHTGTDLGLGLGPYGGAVDADGNFWFHGFGNNKLVRVDYASLDYEIFPGGGYGITVDTNGRVWVNGPQRFDYGTQQWASVTGNVWGGSGGIAQDLQGRIWFANNDKGVTWVDMETMEIGDTLPLGAGPGWSVKGVSTDVDGFIWAVRQDETVAYKIDPDDYSLETYDGLNGPYTYSDMTGGALNNVVCNPPAG